MRHPISLEELREIPIHDAELDLIQLVPLVYDGGQDLSFLIQLHSDEPTETLERFGLEGRRFRLIFKRCWHIQMRIVGGLGSRGTIDDLEIGGEDGLGIQNVWPDPPFSYAHFRIAQSSGSKIAIICERVEIGAE